MITILGILFFGFFILLFLGVPIAISLGLSSVFTLVVGSSVPLLILPQKMFNGIDAFTFMAIPGFLLAGNIMAKTKISDKLVSLASLLVGRFPGGLAHISVGASAFFGAISGSSPATTAAIGSIMIPEMEKRGYDKSYSAAVVAASGALGLIIPPSLTMVIFGVMAGVSIGKLFLCGVFPGILISIGLMGLNYIIAIKAGSDKRERIISGKKAFLIFRDSLLAIIMPVIILGGIYGGIFTPTESAAIACLYGFVIGIFVYRNLNLETIINVLKSTAESTALIMFLMATANLFGYIITAEQLPQKFAALVFEISDNRVVIMFMMLGLFLVVGTFLDNIAALVLLVPTLTGIINQAGIDPIYFGVFTIIALAVGQVTPPVGLNLFIASNIANVKFELVAKKAIPYVLVYVLMLILFIFVPEILTLFAH